MLLTNILKESKMPKTLQTPGSFLALMLEKYKLNPFKLSKDIQLSQSAVRMITIGKTKITTPVAMRLAKYFNTNPEFWLAMQMKWDITEASKDKALMKVVKSISRVKKGTAGGDKTVAAKKPATKKKAAKPKKVAAKRGRKPAAGRANPKKVAVKRGRKPVAGRAKPRKVAAKRGRKPAAPRSNIRKVAAKRGRKPAAGRAKPKKVAVKRGRKPAVSGKKTVGRRGRPAKKK
jgi:addiction module HigA family antidote